LKLLTALLIIITLSCQTDNRTKFESNYEKCVNEKTFNRGIFYPAETSESGMANSVNVFDSIKKFEHYLYKSGNLPDLDKEGYLKLINEIEQTEFLKNEFKEFNSEHYFIEYNLMTSLFHMDFFYVCVMSSFKNQPEYDFILRTKDDVELNSYANKQILTELINNVNFQSETQRLILTYLIYSNLYVRYKMKKKPVANN